MQAALCVSFPLRALKPGGYRGVSRVGLGDLDDVIAARAGGGMCTCFSFVHSALEPRIGAPATKEWSYSDRTQSYSQRNVHSSSLPLRRAIPSRELVRYVSSGEPTFTLSGPESHPTLHRSE